MLGLLLAILCWFDLAGEPPALLAMTPLQKYERMKVGELARHDLIAFARVTMPVPGQEEVVRLSRYVPAEHHYFIAEAVAGLATGERRRADGRRVKRMMLQVPFRHGKSELSVRRLVPWLLGKYPEQSGLVITHTQTLADAHGRDVRDVMRSGGYRLCFGGKRCQLREDTQAMDLLKVQGGGEVRFSGRTLGAGVGADWIIIDDIFKNSREARSPQERKNAWQLFVSDLKSRMNDQNGWLLFIGTRRHADDPQGRLTDARNPHYDAREAAEWEVIRIPALSEGAEVDPLKRAKDVALWPERFDFEFWDKMRTSADVTVREDFETQGQCNPVPAQGTFFKKAWWVGAEAEYDGNIIVKKARPGSLYHSLDELPKRLRNYCASDHAVTEEQRNDATVILPFGVDERFDVWVYPDAMWFRYESTDIVDAMLEVLKKYKPLEWAAEREHISKSILPFLKRRQAEERVFGYIEESSAAAHPEVRAWSFRGMLSSGRWHFPSFADWWGDAEHELLEFPNGAHDDFVSANAHAGMLVGRIIAGGGGNAAKDTVPGSADYFERLKAVRR